MDSLDIFRTLKFLPGIILGLTIHEFSHAYIAHRCGDPTSRNQGRVSLNPLKHIDPLGFIMLLVAGFGWAKPVEFTEANLRNPKTDVLKIAVAGPVSNALLAMLLSVFFAFFKDMEPAGFYNGKYLITELFVYAIYINWGLFIFNLIPIPPLDGSKILMGFLPQEYAYQFAQLERFGPFLLIFILIFSRMIGFNIFWVLISPFIAVFSVLLGIRFF